MTKPDVAVTLKCVSAVFHPDGTIEYAISYLHTDDPPSAPGSKGRTTRASRMARRGLESALEGLDKGDVLWGGFGTSMRESTDHVVVERREHVR
jgi:hypothetical protein